MKNFHRTHPYLMLCFTFLFFACGPRAVQAQEIEEYVAETPRAIFYVRLYPQMTLVGFRNLTEKPMSRDVSFAIFRTRNGKTFMPTCWAASPADRQNHCFAPITAAPGKDVSVRLDAAYGRPLLAYRTGSQIELSDGEAGTRTLFRRVASGDLAQLLTENRPLMTLEQMRGPTVQKPDEVVKTGHGELVVRWIADTSSEFADSGNYSVFFRGRMVLDGAKLSFYQSLATEDTIEFSDRSVVVFVGEAGGNSNPPVYAPVIIYADRAVPASPDTMTSNDGTFRSVKVGEGVEFSLGFRRGVEQKMRLEGDALRDVSTFPTVTSARAKLGNDECEAAQSIVVEECPMMKTNSIKPRQTCGSIKETVLIEEGYALGMSMAGYRSLKGFGQNPAFNRREFTRRCQQACQTQRPPVAGFSKTVCGR